MISVVAAIHVVETNREFRERGERALNIFFDCHRVQSLTKTIFANFSRTNL